jgi:hypothetical protein
MIAQDKGARLRELAVEMVAQAVCGADGNTMRVLSWNCIMA